MPRPRKSREDYVTLEVMTTRWRDNDAYGHMNNAVFYEYVDACVNGWLVNTAGLKVPDGPIIGLVVETACIFHAGLGWPDSVTTGLKVRRIGTSSVQYDIGLFRGDEVEAAAEARFTHVYVDATTRRPTPIPDGLRMALNGLMVD